MPPRTDPGGRDSRTGLPPRVVNDESHEQLLVHVQAPGTRFPGSVSGTCVALSCFPRSLPLAPPTPPLVAQVCSPVSLLLWKGLTSPARASSASTPRLPDPDSSEDPPSVHQSLTQLACHQLPY